MGVGENIRVFRILNDMTQEELADKMGYKSKTSINKIEKEVKHLPLDKLQKIADILHTTPSVLLGNEPSVDNVLSVQLARIMEEKGITLEPKSKEAEDRLSDYLVKLIDLASEINDEGLERLIQYAEDIKDKYRKEEDQ